MSDTPAPALSGDSPETMRLSRPLVRESIDADRAERLAEIWETRPGWRGWFSTVDHKTIGLRYLVTSFLFLLLGGVEALVMRVQLAQPNATVLSPEQYNQ